MQTRRSLLAAAFSVGLIGVCHAQGAAPTAPPERVRGTITAVAADSMQMKTREGKDISISFPANVPVTGIIKSDINEIKPGSYIGTAAMPMKNGSLRALEIQVFPESMRGVGEGFHPWDVRPNSTMTNGTVGTVKGTKGRVLTITYQGGEKNVVVPAKAPVITYEPSTRAIVTTGAHALIFVKRNPDGSMVALRVNVGENGLVPPM